MLIQGQVGAPSSQASIAPGTNPPIRQGQLGDVIASQLHGRYYEATYRQSVFSTFVNGLSIGVATTYNSPLTAGTGTPIIGIYNPIGSGKNLSLIRVQNTPTSGTSGGPLLWNIIPNPQSITAATNATAYNMGTLTQTGSVTKIWNATAITGSPSNGVPFRDIAGPSSAASVVGAIQTYMEEIAGSIIVPPGSMIAMATTAAGTSYVFSAYVEWEEIPI